MDLDRMLAHCERDQWRVDDLDWSRPPRAMAREDEETVVQLFTDMEAIERLAQALFVEQEKRVEDPRLKKIFRSFVKDEARHAQAAKRLAAHYDVHRYRRYQVNASLARFTPHFLDAIRYLSDDVANAYVTAGELILDVALLRALDDFVDDPMSAQAMRLINRDESRHIAVDYHMVEYYASDAYTQRLAQRRKDAVPLRARAQATWTFACVLYGVKPFLRDAFLVPMDRLDPSGRRLREAFKRYQILGNKPVATLRPFGRFMRGLQETFNHPVLGPLLGRVVARIAGAPPQYMRRLYTPEDIARASAMSYEALAEEAVAAKYSTVS